MADMADDFAAMRSRLTDEVLKRFLLGQLPEQETEEIEEAFLTDDAVKDRVEVAQGQLIEAYLDGELSTAEQRLFHQRFTATAKQRQDIRLIASLRKMANEKGNS